MQDLSIPFTPDEAIRIQQIAELYLTVFGKPLTETIKYILIDQMRTSDRLMDGMYPGAERTGPTEHSNFKWGISINTGRELRRFKWDMKTSYMYEAKENAIDMSIELAEGPSPETLARLAAEAEATK